MASLLVRLKININISQGVERGLAIQMGQTVPNFYRKKNQTIISQTSS